MADTPTILTDLAHLAAAWADDPQPPDLPEPFALSGAFGVGPRPPARSGGYCGRWENGAPRFFGVGPRGDHAHGR